MITPAVIQLECIRESGMNIFFLTLLIRLEVSRKGLLEALMNFQDNRCDRTAVPLANCSLLDETTAAAEAVPSA